MYTTLQIQTKLKSLGFDPVWLDGIPGRKTTAAISAFQASRKLPVTGVADAKTLSVLFDVAVVQTAVSQSFPWIELAMTKKGLLETRDNSLLRSFLKLGKGTIGDPARIPWCGDFVETCIAVTLPKESIPTNPYAAINWLKFGKYVKPSYGCILVFHRGDPKSWEGHVGFYVGEDSSYYHVLGGNQSNSVSITKIAKSRLRPEGSRWPLTVAASGQAVQADGSGLIVTTNEA